MIYMSLYIVVTYKYTSPQITASSCYGNINYVDGRAVTTEGFSWLLPNLTHKLLSMYLFIYSSLHVSSMACSKHVENYK